MNFYKLQNKKGIKIKAIQIYKEIILKNDNLKVALFN